MLTTDIYPCAANKEDEARYKEEFRKDKVINLRKLITFM